MASPEEQGHEASAPEPPQARWFRTLAREIEDEYERLHRAALQDPQRAGHGGEGTWVTVLSEWLPPGYDVVTRKYIVPEVGSEEFETDILVLHPSYPVPFRTREEILAGGVAAAFSVKLTLDASGIRDGVRRAIALRRALKPRYGTPREEITAPFPVGLLAHSHSWKAPDSEPRKNIAERLWSLEHELVRHPRESLDYLCVADLGLRSSFRVPYMPPDAVQYNAAATPAQRVHGAAYAAISQTEPSETFTAVASLITHLLVRLSYLDPSLRPLADNLRLTGTLGSESGPTRVWDLDSVFSDTVRAQLPFRGLQQGDDDWASALF